MSTYDPAFGASYSSGGGFSNLFPRPAYQDAVISKYIESLGTTNQGLYNPNGRAYPDVSAVGTFFPTYYGAQQQGLVDGTSMATPIFASVLALVNDRRLAAGKSTIGFINPALYASNGHGLRDITSGINPGCGTDGFPAQKG